MAFAQEIPLTACMGLHTGPVVVGYLDNDPLRLYTAVGETTHLATQLQHRARPGTIVISAATHRLVAHEAQCQACGTLEGSSGAAPVAVYMVQSLIQHGAGPGTASVAGVSLRGVRGNWPSSRSVWPM